MIDIIQALNDPQLFQLWFKDIESRKAWLVVLKAIFALPMNDEELVLFHTLTGREKPPKQQVKESWWVIGRRGGKSFTVALIAVFLASFHDYSRYLSPGERGVVMIIAADRKQARVIFRYLLALLENVPMLARLIARSDKESVELTNGINIEIHTASFRSTRGYTVVAALLDEVAFWRSEDSANPDYEIVNALRPSMATIPNAMLIGLGSPYRRTGILYDMHRTHYGQNDDDILVVQADTRTMNPSVPQSFIDKAYERDPVAASAEYGAQFRTDISGYLRSEWLDLAIQPGRALLPPIDNFTYSAFVDPSGGGQDAFTLSIVHREGERMVIDAVYGRSPPFNPSAVVAEYAAFLKSYRVYTITGDRYAGQWPAEAFHKHGIQYNHSELTKSQIYLEAEPLFAQGKVELPDHRTLFNQLRQLERRTGRAGRDSVDHPPSGHDDYANAVCGALVLVTDRKANEVKMIKMSTGYEFCPDGFQF